MPSERPLSDAPSSAADSAATSTSNAGTRGSTAAKIAQIADRRLVEYFVIVSSVEQAALADHRKAAADSKQQQQNGDISFSDWKTEASFDHGDEEDVFSAYQFKPTITARYPLHDHPDNPLHDNVTFFCHPSGGIQLRTEEYMPKVRALMRGACKCMGARSCGRVFSHNYIFFVTHCC